jgi:hypothetical protein
MTISLLQIIATLCIIPSGQANSSYLANQQLKCQQYYIVCAKDANILDPAKKLAECVLNKPEVK